MNNDVQDAFSDTSVAFSAKSDSELKKAFWLFRLVNQPLFSKIATKMVKASFFLHLPIKPIIRSTVFDHFCGGEDIQESIPTVKKLGSFNVKTILDYSVEGEKTEKGFDETLTEILKILDKARGIFEIPFGVFKVTGIASAELLTRVQSQENLTEVEQKAYDRIKQRIESISQKGFDNDVPVYIDAEDSWYQDPIDDIAYDMMNKFNIDKTIVYNTYQMYRTDSLTNLKNAYQKAVDGNYFLGAKLVRGAYMEKERDRAQEFGYDDPIHPNKEATDQSFDDALKFCIDKRDRISVCCGSHNEYSNFYLTQLMEQANMKNDDPRVSFAQLYGMSDNISFNLAKAGYNVTKYLPYGPVQSVMPYLFRRAEENTSISGQSSREYLLIKKEIQRRKKAKQG